MLFEWKASIHFEPSPILSASKIKDTAKPARIHAWKWAAASFLPVTALEITAKQLAVRKLEANKEILKNTRMAQFTYPQRSHSIYAFVSGQKEKPLPFLAQGLSKQKLDEVKKTQRFWNFTKNKSKKTFASFGMVKVNRIDARKNVVSPVLFR